MSQQNALLESIADTIADYREGQIPRPTPAHVEKWISQFDAGVRLPILQEMDHVLKKTYFSKDRVLDFLRGLLNAKDVTGNNPRAFWENAHFLNIQQSGSSQVEMLRLLDRILREEFGLSITNPGADSNEFVYLDDGIFSGNRIRTDLKLWIADLAPNVARVHVITMVQYTNGRHYAKTSITQLKETTRKDIDTFWCTGILLENRRGFKNSSDVLWPVGLPDDVETREYAKRLRPSPEFRRAGQIGKNKLFSSDSARQILENEFLKTGVKIRRICPLLGEYQRPLGNMRLNSLGLGSLVVTYRNCPNNAPLALWAGNPWYPLFRRVTN